MDDETYFFVYLLIVLTEVFAGAYSFQKLQSVIVMEAWWPAGRNSAGEAAERSHLYPQA